MKLIDLIGFVLDDVKVYEYGNDAENLFVDLYKGCPSGLPPELRKRMVVSIGAARKGVVDIKVV